MARGRAAFYGIRTRVGDTRRWTESPHTASPPVDRSAGPMDRPESGNTSDGNGFGTWREGRRGRERLVPFSRSGEAYHPGSSFK